MVVSPTINKGVIVYWQPIMINGVDQALGYSLNWSKTSIADCEGSQTGGGGMNLNNHPLWEDSGGVVILDGANSKNPFYTTVNTKGGNGTTYFFCMQGLNGAGAVGAWATAKVTLAAPATSQQSGDAVLTVPVTFSSHASGPLYTGCYAPATHQFYAVSDETHPWPTTKSYTLYNVPNGASCEIFGVFDLDGDGLATPAAPEASPYSVVGNIYNFNRNTTLVSISGTTTQSLSLNPYSGDITAAITTQNLGSWTDASGTAQPESYSVTFTVNEMVQLPVAVELTSGPNVIAPVDFSLCAACGVQGGFVMTLSTGSTQPQAGDTYVVTVTDESGTVDTPSVVVSGVVPAAELATDLNATGGTMPTFTWGYPLINPTNYNYQFTLWDGNGNVIWQIPATAGSGFSSTAVTSIVWGSDPLGGNNLPSVPSLTSGQSYVWAITTLDSNGNAAVQKAAYKP